LMYPPPSKISPSFQPYGLAYANVH
jgi:hypothetical protein